MDNKQSIRVAQIIGKMWAGGVEMVVFNYYRELDKNKVQFDFFYDEDSTIEPPKDLIAMGARFYKIPPYQDLKKYSSVLRKHFKENNYNIVHSHINTLSVFPLFIAKTVGIPVRIAHNHSVPGGKEWKRNVLKYFLKIFSKVFSTDYFACSEKAGRWLFGNKCFEKDKVVVIKNAIDFNKFVISNEERSAFRQQLCLNEKLVVGHVGRFTFAKNHELLLLIFKEILKSRKEAVLLLIGDGELHQKIKDQIAELDLVDSVVLTGKVSNPEKYYPLMDVLVLPSIFEGFSLTTLEAQAAGVPIVLSEVVPKEAIISNGCRYMNSNDAPSFWAKATIEISSTNVVLSQQSAAYNINESALKLTKWYLKKQSNLKENEKRM